MFSSSFLRFWLSCPISISNATNPNKILSATEVGALSSKYVSFN